MTTIPTLQILFALFMMIRPEGTASFTIQMENGGSPVVWTLQEDGWWSGQTEDGKTTFGSWKADGMTVVSKSGSGEKTIELSKWITRTEKGFAVDGDPLKIAMVRDTGAWLLHTPEGLFETPVRIETKK